MVALSFLGNGIHRLPRSYGMHQTIVVNTNLSLPIDMQSESFNLLFVFLMPVGAFLDEYELMVSNRPPPV